MSAPTSMVLTHLSRMEFTTLINWTSPFTFEGLVGVVFLFVFSNFIRNSGDPDQTPLIWVCTVCL